jgi:hypothetical protein
MICDTPKNTGWFEDWLQKSVPPLRETRRSFEYIQVCTPYIADSLSFYGRDGWEAWFIRTVMPGIEEIYFKRGI